MKFYVNGKNVHEIKLIISNSDAKVRWGSFQFAPFTMLAKAT